MSTPSLPMIPEVLANLDYLVQGPGSMPLRDRGYGSYKTRILEQIAGNLQSVATVDQVRELLREVFGVNERFPEDAFNLAFRHGSSILELDDETRTFLNHHLDRLHVQGRPRDRRLRTSTISTGQEERQPGAKSSERSGSQNTRKSSRRLKTSSKRVRKPAKAKTAQCKVAISGIETNETPNSFSNASSATTGVRNYKQTSGENEIGEQASVSEDKDMIFDNTSEQSNAKSAVNSILSTAALFNAEFSTMSTELELQRERCRKAEHEREDFAKQLRIIEIDKRAPLNKNLLQEISKMSRLQKQIDELQALKGYFSFGTIHTTTKESHRLVSQFQRLKNEILKITVMGGSQEPPIGELKGSSSDLSNLLVDIFGEEVLYNQKAISSAFTPLKTYELVQALTGAAICKWVFASEYFTYVTGTTPLLQEYRILIRALCGQEAVYDLDIAAHKSIIEHESFRNVMASGMTETITSRLTDAILPLLDPESTLSAVQNLQPFLRATLRLAVRIRMESLVTAQHLELIWPSFRSPYNKKIMESGDAGSKATSSLVRLPVCPGVRAFPKEKAMVSYGALSVNAALNMSPDFTIKAFVLR